MQMSAPHSHHRRRRHALIHHHQETIFGSIDESYDPTQFCLDVMYDMKTVMIWGCHGGDNQMWVYLDQGQIFSPYASMCLDLIDGITANGGTVSLYQCSTQTAFLHPSNPHQTWHFRSNFGWGEWGVFYLTINGKNFCLHAGSRSNGTNVKIWPCEPRSTLWQQQKVFQTSTLVNIVMYEHSFQEINR